MDATVPAPGTSKALVHRIIGTTLAQPIDATSTRVYLTDVSEFPDPAVVGSYGSDGASVLLGYGGNVAERVVVVAKGPNYLDVTRGTPAQGAKAHAAGEAFSLDRKNSWNRPLGAFGSPKNGKLTPDIGIANGFKDRSADWRFQHNQFRGAWWGHPDYEALYDAKWPVNGYDTGSWHTYTDTFDGNEFWLQYRQKISASRFAAGMPRGKLNYIQNVCNDHGTAVVFHDQAGHRSAGCTWSMMAKAPTDLSAFHWREWIIEPDTWETYMFHIRPGHRLTPDSTLEVFAAHEGDTSWTTLYSNNTFSIHFYPPAANYSECEAYNNFQPRNNPNHYQGSSGGGSCRVTNYVAYTQIILSRNSIPIPK